MRWPDLRVRAHGRGAPADAPRPRDPTLPTRKAELGRAAWQIWPFDATDEPFYVGDTNPALRAYVRALVFEVASGGDERHIMDEAARDDGLAPPELRWLERAHAEIALRDLGRLAGP